MSRRKFRPKCTGTHPAPFGPPAFGGVVHFQELKDYDEFMCIGQGENGKVYHARLANGHEVAIKRFFTPEDVLDNTSMLLMNRPAAFDHELFPVTRAAFDRMGIFVYVQELCCALDPACQKDRAAAVTMLAACSELLLKSEISHADIKFANLLKRPSTLHILLGDLDSVVPISKTPRLSRYDGIGTHTQFVFGCTDMAPESFEVAIPKLRFREFDYHLNYPAVQFACMLFSSLVTSIELQPCQSEHDPGLPPIWHISVAHGCQINMVVLEALSRRHQTLFARFCFAWTAALDLVCTEKDAEAAVLSRHLSGILQ